MNPEMKPNIDDFYAEALSYPEPEFRHGWGRASLLKVKTKIFHYSYESEGKQVTEIGNMILYKVNKWGSVAYVCDAISSEMDEVAVAIQKSITDDENDEHQDEDACCAGDPFVLEHFALKPEFQKKRLGHIALHLGLQASGCEGHPVFIKPAEDGDKYAGFDFLNKFYLDAEKGAYVVPGTEVILYCVYNDSSSVAEKREERLAAEPNLVPKDALERAYAVSALWTKIWPDVTALQSAMFSYISFNEGCIQTELAVELDADRSAVTRFVDVFGTGKPTGRKKCLGYVEARRSEDDERIKTLHLTSKGRDLVHTIQSILHDD